MSQHELLDFLKRTNEDIEREYERISWRVSEDPGTAGDQGEENWKKLLKLWLPSGFEIVTKGRILGTNGNASPQLDVIVLSPDYPKQLIDCKLYLAGGVVAAFERFYSHFLGLLPIQLVLLSIQNSLLAIVSCFVRFHQLVWSIHR